MLVMLIFKQGIFVGRGSPLQQIAQNVSFYKSSIRKKKSCQKILTGSQKRSNVEKCAMPPTSGSNINKYAI